MSWHSERKPYALQVQIRRGTKTMDITQVVKDIVSLTEGIKNAELHRQIMNLNSEVLTLCDENDRLRQELRDYKEKLALRE